MKEAGVNKTLIKGTLPVYKACVKALQQVLEAEENDELLPSDILNTTRWL